MLDDVHEEDYAQPAAKDANPYTKTTAMDDDDEEEEQEEEGDEDGEVQEYLGVHMVGEGQKRLTKPGRLERWNAIKQVSIHIASFCSVLDLLLQQDWGSFVVKKHYKPTHNFA